jgi:hypothetical protein
MARPSLDEVSGKITLLAYIFDGARRGRLYKPTTI